MICRYIYTPKRASFTNQSNHFDHSSLITHHSSLITFQVCVIGHMRSVKDPFRAPMAARLLPESSRVRMIHVGGAMTEAIAERARREMEINPRYRWIGEQPRWRVRQILTRSRL